MKRFLAPLSLVLVAAAGCSSATSTVATGANSAATSVATSAPTPSETPSAAPVAGGTATDFCGAFQELQAVSEAPSGDMATVGAKFQAAAADMRKYAPADIKAAAGTYADVMDNLGKAAAGGTMDEAGLSKAISDGMGGNAKDIGTVAVWVAKNCKL